MKCKICGKSAQSEYCFAHKPRKMLPKRASKKTNNSDVLEMMFFFLKIWEKRPHVSEVSGNPLGKEPLTVFFHHILPKNKYPEAMYDEENIILLTLDEHTNVEIDLQRYEIINELRKQLEIKYDITKIFQ